MRRSEERKKKKPTGKMVLVCLFLIFVVYIGVNLIINSGGSMTTYIAREGEATESFTVDGYIFKDQAVIVSPEDGYLECVAGEAGRIGKNGAVAYIYKNEVDASVKNRIAEIDEKIKKLETDNRSMTASENDAIRLEQDIAKEVSTIALYVRNEDMESVAKIRENLDDIVESKRKISGDDPSGEEALRELRAEKSQLENKNDMTKTVVRSEKSGSFTAVTDGLEEILDDDKLGNITQGYLEDIKASEEKEKESTEIKKGDEIGKVVDTYVWYFAAVVDIDIADTLKKGDSIRLKFLDSSDNIINGSVYNITDENDDKAVIVIKSSQYVDNLYSMSMAKVEVIRKTYEGIKIPAKGVRVKDDEKGVYIVSGNKIRFRNAKIYYIDKNWAVISREEKNGIKLYDEVVVSGSNMYEGKVVR